MKVIVGLISFLLLSFIHAEDVGLSYRGGVYHIPVTLNSSVRLDFVVDTGAASVYMPNDVFRTLIRTGTVNESDILGTVKNETASGEIIESLKVNIRKLQIGNQIISNVEASVGGTNASLLLGQSALRQLEPWSINTTKKILSIKSSTPEEVRYSYNSEVIKAYNNSNNSQSKTITRSKILSFIDDYISRGNSRDLKGVMNLYDERVDYFGAGVVSKNFIYEDKVKYYKRWPSMQVELINIDDIQNIGGRDYETMVTYSIYFDVYNYVKQKGIQGKATNKVILKNDNGTLKIVSDKQQVHKRGKY